jgi:hypothetical protein
VTIVAAASKDQLPHRFLSVSKLSHDIAVSSVA